MAELEFHRDNHYVPILYLKSWSSSLGRTWIYRAFVSHDRIPLWKETSFKGVAYHTHLYTRVVAGQETDEFEKWLDREFESPAAEPLRKISSGCNLKPSDWKHLNRFVASQYIRTPAWYLRFMKRWERNGKQLLDKTLEDAVQAIETAQERGEPVERLIPLEGTEYIPIKTTVQSWDGHDEIVLKAQTMFGRGVWQFLMRQMNKHAEILECLRWSVLTPPSDMSWITSDDPVIRLNRHDSGGYDFNGGFGKKRSEILFPLNPRHLLYAQVGRNPRLRGLVHSQQAEDFQRYIAEHAHRLIFAASPDDDIQRLRPRVVNPELVRSESEEWQKWHEKQTLAEQQLMGSRNEKTEDQNG